MRYNHSFSPNPTKKLIGCLYKTKNTTYLFLQRELNKHRYNGWPYTAKTKNIFIIGFLNW